MDTLEKRENDAMHQKAMDAKNAEVRTEKETKGFGHDMKDKVEHAGHVAKEKMTEAKNTAKEKATEAKHSVEESAQKAKDRMKEKFD